MGWGFQRIQPLCREQEQPQLGCFQELSSTRVLFLSAVCWLLGRLWRVRTMCQRCDRTFVPARAWLGVWDCSLCRYFIHERSTLCLNPGLWNSERSRDRSLAIQQNTYFFFPWQGLCAIMPVAMALSVKQKSYGINRFLYVLTFTIGSLLWRVPVQSHSVSVDYCQKYWYDFLCVHLTSIHIKQFSYF